MTAPYGCDGASGRRATTYEATLGTVVALVEGFVFSDHIETRLRPPAHGDASGVRGAAWLWDPGEDPSA